MNLNTFLYRSVYAQSQLGYRIGWSHTPALWVKTTPSPAPGHQQSAVCPGTVCLFVVQSLSVRLFVTSWTVARQAPGSSTVSWSSLKFTSTESVTFPRKACHKQVEPGTIYLWRLASFTDSNAVFESHPCHTSHH